MEDASGVALRTGVRLGRRIGPFEGRLDSELVDKFKEASKDPSGRVRSPRAVPPVAVVTQLWDAQEAGRTELIPEDFQSEATGGVHGDHDLVVHRPIRPGEPLQTWVEGGAARTKGSNSVVTLRYVTTDAQNEVVAEQLWRTVWLGVRCLDVGEAPPPHDFPDAARAALSDPGTSTWMARWPGATRSSRETGLGITLTRRPPDEAVPRGPSSTASVPWPSAPEGSARQSLAATRNVLVGSHCASHDLCCWARG